MNKVACLALVSLVFAGCAGPGVVTSVPFAAYRTPVQASAVRTSKTMPADAVRLASLSANLD